LRERAVDGDCGCHGDDEDDHHGADDRDHDDD
jgi:hypothetical protein